MKQQNQKKGGKAIASSLAFYFFPLQGNCQTAPKGEKGERGLPGLPAPPSESTQNKSNPNIAALYVLDIFQAT